ncbi:MAG: hypothetical protein KAI18_01520 [Candidatus Aenigmarchaeota archaeon]|nr:hypothetical protein [Candidatus Aenigmarchaeota archaeon]
MQPNTKKTLIIISLILVTATAFFILEQDDNQYLQNDCDTEDTHSEICPIDDMTLDKIDSFETCAAAGNPIMESYPRQCRAGDQTYVEDISVKCTAEQRDVDACITLYEPVCATVNIQCITAPCNPIKETFSNSCFACRNPLVESYVPGEC